MEEGISQEEMERYIESHPTVRDWLAGYATSSHAIYARGLMRVATHLNMEPQEMLGLKEGGGLAMEKLLDRYVIESPHKESVKRTDVTAVHSFFKSHYLDLAAKSGFSKVRYQKVKEYKCPTQDDLRRLRENTHIRDDAIINALSSGGFRDNTASKLVWGDLHELWNWDGEIPIHIRVESRRLKGGGVGRYKGVEQHTFLTPFASQVMLRYAAWYEERCGSIREPSPLFVTIGANQSTEAFEALQSPSNVIRRLGAWSGHDLRRFHQTQLEQARLHPNWIRKMQGKKVPREEAPYSRPKIEALRGAFTSAIPYVTLAPPRPSVNPMEVRKQALLDSAAFLFREDPQKLELLRALLVRVSTEQELADARDEWWTKTVKIDGGFPDMAYKSVLIDAEDLPHYLDRGYDVVAELTSGKIAVRRRR